MEARQVRQRVTRRRRRLHRAHGRRHGGHGGDCGHVARQRGGRHHRPRQPHLQLAHRLGPLMNRQRQLRHVLARAQQPFALQPTARARARLRQFRLTARPQRPPPGPWACAAHVGAWACRPARRRLPLWGRVRWATSRCQWSSCGGGLSSSRRVGVWEVSTLSSADAWAASAAIAGTPLASGRPSMAGVVSGSRAKSS
jgi:hypothetical protein